MSKPNYRPLARTGLRYRQFPKGILFENGIALNETAFAIFNLCNGAFSINDIALKLSKQFNCPLSEVAPHIQKTLDLLAEADLIVQAEVKNATS